MITRKDIHVHCIIRIYFLSGTMWVNAFVQRLFFDFFNEEYWSFKVQSKIQKKLNKIKVGLNIFNCCSIYTTHACSKEDFFTFLSVAVALVQSVAVALFQSVAVALIQSVAAALVQSIAVALDSYEMQYF